jgi:hypothetical protein
MDIPPHGYMQKPGCRIHRFVVLPCSGQLTRLTYDSPALMERSILDSSIGFMIDVVNYNNDTKFLYQVSKIEYLPEYVEGSMPVARQVVGLGMCTGLNFRMYDLHQDKRSLPLKSMALHSYVMGIWFEQRDIFIVSGI